MKNIFLIVNPKSGTKNYKNILNLVKNEFKKFRVEYTLNKTEYSGHAIDLVRSCDLEKYDFVCAIGGDGTFNEVLNGMLIRDDSIKIPIGLIPGGTGNSFMKTIDCLEPVDAINKIFSNKLRSIDVMKVNTSDRIYYSLNLVGWGMATDISIFAERLRFVGGQRYNIASIFEIIKNKKREAKLIVDGEERNDDYCFIISCNTKYIGKGMKMAPYASIDDGLIDLIIVKKTSRTTLLSVFPKLFNGTHIDHDACEYLQCRSFSIIPNEKGQLNIDGEIIGSTPVNVNIIKEGIELLV
tara:strand:- start:633 stop:1520 length:888 start_codon:yes stop_codon:yes gene_type:complete